MTKILLLLPFFFLYFNSFSTAQENLSFEAVDSLYLHYNEQDLYYDALKYAARRVEVLEQNKAPEDSLYIVTLYELGANYFNCNEAEKGETLLLKAQEICIKVLGKKSISYATIMINLGNIYRAYGDYEDAEASFKIAIAIYEKDIDSYEFFYTIAISNLALTYDYIGDYDTAEPLYKESIDRFKKMFGIHDMHYIDALLNLGVYYDIINELDEAERIYLEVQNLLRENGETESLDYARCIGNLGTLYVSMGYYDQAEALLLECLKTFKEYYGADGSQCSSVLMGLGALYEETKRYKESEAYYLEALHIDGTYLGTDSYDYGVTLNNLSILYESMNQTDKALEAYLKVKKIFAEKLGKDHPHYGICLINLSCLYGEDKQCEKAIPFAKEAIELFADNYGVNHLNYLMAVNSLIDAYVYMKDYEAAWDYSYHAIECNLNVEKIDRNIDKAWTQKVLEKDYVSIHELNSTLHSIHSILDDHFSIENTEKKLILSDLVMDLLTKKRLEFNSESDQLDVLEKSAKWVHYGLRNTVDLREEADWQTHKEKAFNFAETNKSVLLSGAIQTDEAYIFGDLPDSLAQKEQQLQNEYAEVKAILQEDIDEEEQSIYRQDLSDLAQEIDLLKVQIEKEYPRYSELKYSNKRASVSDVQETLDDKTALLEFVVGDSAVYLFYLDKNSLKLFETKIPYKILQHRILLLHQALSNYNALLNSPDKAYGHYVKNAYWFYKKLLEKPLKEAKGIEQLVIVTDRELGHLPFEAFLMTEGENIKNYQKLDYLIHDYAVSYNYSATLFVDGMKKKNAVATSGEMLALAGDYSEQINEKTVNFRLPVHQKIRAGLSELPAAKEEVEALAEHFDGDFVFGKEANETFFKEHASDYSIIHLAMHGVLDRRSPILSSLVFTENQGEQENNFLQAYEISQMHLNAELVVLSACETGFGKFEQGNGIASLARSFMYAGVPSLVVTLWQVNDQSTAIVMQNFYENLRNGMDKAEALRQAKLNYIKNANGLAGHPAFWSPFVQLGNRQVINVSQRNGTFWWWIGGGLCLLFLGFLASFKKRAETV